MLDFLDEQLFTGICILQIEQRIQLHVKISYLTIHSLIADDQMPILALVVSRPSQYPLALIFL
jgi:hypothetical protein